MCRSSIRAFSPPSAIGHSRCSDALRPRRRERKNTQHRSFSSSSRGCMMAGHVYVPSTLYSKPIGGRTDTPTSRPRHAPLVPRYIPTVYIVQESFLYSGRHQRYAGQLAAYKHAPSRRHDRLVYMTSIHIANIQHLDPVSEEEREERAAHSSCSTSSGGVVELVSAARATPTSSTLARLTSPRKGARGEKNQVRL